MRREVEEYNYALSAVQADLPAIDRAAIAWRAFSRPATEDEIFTELEKLQARYHAFDADPALAATLDAEWLEDLDGLSIGQIMTACKAWRMSDTAFSPRSAGQLLPLTGPAGDASARMYERIAHIARTETPALPDPKISDENRKIMGERMKTMLRPRPAELKPTATELEARRVKTLAELRAMADQGKSDD